MSAASAPRQSLPASQAVYSGNLGASLSHSRPPLPWPVIAVQQVVTPSTLKHPDPRVQLDNVVAAFNSRSLEAYHSLDASFTTSFLRGERVPPTDFAFFARNQVPCCSQDTSNLLARTLTPNPSVKTEKVCNSVKTEPYIGIMGSHIINVPVGQYGKILTGSSRQAQLLDEGPHVIHDPTLLIDERGGFLVAKSKDYIDHGTLHLLRVPPGKVAKVWYGVQAVLLESQTEPYVIVSPLFRFSELVDQNAPLISHGTSHRVRVPKGCLAKVWVNNVPHLLPAREEHYEYVTPYFSTSTAGDWLVDSNAKLVVHGSIKRIMPSTGEVCVAYENGGADRHLARPRRQAVHHRQRDVPRGRLPVHQLEHARLPVRRNQGGTQKRVVRRY